ncbi:hypothetical protein HHK36_002050 [Tetracentron sinense]|uniref:Plant bHLH transcription factor ACT-like domain-containing protein n=1 Tax=Tetracentron sinense TaxID=13715 RepID=A0A835A3U1_TETSI|nr:hypothetical protein HHK36_002050 [Tetracentron sinense]
MKLDDRLKTLRSLKKATIITDAITYIGGLQKQVKGLSEQLLEMEVLSEEEEKLGKEEHEIQQCKIEVDVKVSGIYGNKLWIQIICEKKRGGFTKLVEAISDLGFEVTDTNFTTSGGAALISFCVEVRLEAMFYCGQMGDSYFCAPMI